MNYYLIYSGRKKHRKNIEKIGIEMDKRINFIFGNRFNELINKAIKTISKNEIPEPDLYGGKKNLNNILNTIQIIRDETSSEKIINEYKKHQKKYVKKAVKEHSINN